jgi:acetate kinase
MKVLVINCGSSSLKYQLFDMDNENVLAKGIAEKIGLEGSFMRYRPADAPEKRFEQPLPNHEAALDLIFSSLANPEYGVIKSLADIDAIGHRVVHAGERYAGSVVITEDVMQALRECIPLAPLHNPPNLVGIEACQKLMPGKVNVGVFDTAFHQTMPPVAYLYGIPYQFYKEDGVRRYGFHGTSHRYVSQEAADYLGRPLSELKIITCHLGNGSSITAVDRGKSIDTTMGLTPLEGLMMGTRSGDIDPAIIPFLMERRHLTAHQVDTILNKESGAFGVSGVSSDFRVIEDAAAAGNERAQIALDIFSYRVRKYVGAYLAVLDGADAIVFTAGLGENSPETRRDVMKFFHYVGVEIDPEKNKVRGGKFAEISTPDSKIKVLVVPTNEELMIARDTVELAKQAR